MKLEKTPNRHLNNSVLWRAMLVLLALCCGLLLPAAMLAQTDATPEPPPVPTAVPTTSSEARMTPTATTAAPTNAPGAIPQVHTVEAGENLTYIAETYGVSLEALNLINDLQDDAILQVGQTLIIPGGSGEAVSAVYTVQLGDTLAGVAAQFNTTPAALLEESRLINPYYDLAVGQLLPLVSRTGTADPQTITGSPLLAEEGDSLLALAAGHGLSRTALAAANGLDLHDFLFPGQRIRLPGDAPYRFLPGDWRTIALRPLPVRQGGTVSIYVENLRDGQPVGEFAGQQLRFAPFDDGHVALVGIDAFTEPGRYPLVLGGDGERPFASFRQSVTITAQDFVTQSITVDAELSDLLDMDLRREEDAFLRSIYARFSEQPLWEGRFQVPVTDTIVTAGYGGGRSYNGGPIQIFHTGVDFGGDIGTPILAPAAGVVVFSDSLELRGLSVIVDHGLGVMTGYYHLSDIFVTEGNSVTPGQPLGAGGSSGLSTGPHLHWDLRIMNVPVDGLQWTETTFP